MAEYLAMDTEDVAWAKKMIEEDLSIGQVEAAVSKIQLLQLEMLERISMQMVRIADSLERLEGK